ncbi:peptidase [Acidaminobacter sp. JC074]|uniref:rod-binding protein n=1 Tax=Acidaminobacter sp. JC074 TaxID=2530199 RepID=UPI001F105905|nr:rod-binding protein [Acidaminobacter sp. JC074]MCH4889322.1 peptidase [Acidaminobacter sp. JC074]
MKVDAIVANAQIEQSKQEAPVSSTDFDKLLEEAKKTGDTSELRKAANEFEAVFLNMMMKTMRNSIPESEGIFKKSEAEKTFEGMLDEEMTKQMAQAGGIGIGDMIYEQFEKYVEEEEVSSFELKG